MVWYSIGIQEITDFGWVAVQKKCPFYTDLSTFYEIILM